MSELSSAVKRVLGKINEAKERSNNQKYPYFPEGNHYVRVQRVSLFKNRDDVTCFKMEGDIEKSSVAGVSGVHVLVLKYAGPYAAANQEETRQVLSAVMSSSMDLLNDALQKAVAAGEDLSEKDRKTLENYRFRPLAQTRAEDAINQGWLEVDFGEEDRIPADLLSNVDLHIYTSSYSKKMWKDKEKTQPRLNESGVQETFVVHNWRGVSQAELRKEGIIK